MSETFIADMRHFTGPEEAGRELPGPTIRMRAFLGRIIEAATVSTPGRLLETELRCRRRPGHKPCPGPLQVMLTEVPAQIRWICPACGDNGTITHWRGTPWDLTPRASGRDREAGWTEVLLTGIEHRALQQIDILDATAREIVDRGRTTPEGVVLRGREEQMEDLAGFVAAEVNHEKRSSRKTMLRAILDRMQADSQPLELR